MGLVGAYVFYELRVERQLAAPLALAAGVLASGGVGAVFELLIMRRMREASMLARVVATLALLVVLQGAAILRYGPFPRLVPSMLPVGPVDLGPITIGADRVWIGAIVGALTVALWAVHRFTVFGVATTAVAENPRAAAALAVSPNAVAVANWATGSALGGLGAILLVPITGLGSSNLTWLVVPVLAAAVIGRFSSFPVTMAAGITIGVAQSLITRYVETPGMGTAVPFVIAAVVLLSRGASVAAKDQRFGRLPQLGSGRRTPVLIAGAVGVTLLCGWVLLPDDWRYALTAQVIVAVVLMSLVVVTGFAGQISLAQFAFAGIGAMGTSWLVFHQGWSFGPALGVGALLAAPIGVLVGLAGVRARGVELAIVTLGFAISVTAVVFGNPEVMRRVAGRLDRLELLGIDITPRDHPERYLTVCVGVLVLVGLVVCNLRRSRTGRRLIAVRTNERAAAAMGIAVVGAKLYAFVLGAVIAALGGVLLAFRDPIPRFGEFDGLRSIDATQQAVLGGVGTVGGPLVGTFASADGVGQRSIVFLGVLGERAQAAIIVAIGANVLLLAMLTVSPDGLTALLERWSRRWLGRRRAPVPAVDERPVHRPRSKVTAQTLRVEHLSVWFGGTCALDDFSMFAEPGEVVGVIGPNGAGKSTAIEAITGFVPTRTGSVRLGGTILDRRSRAACARAGLARSFQSLELFDDLTVLENLQAAADRRDRAAYLTNLVVPGDDDLPPLAHELVADLGFAELLHRRVSSLAYSERRMLAVIRAVAGGPSVVLLDEPAAGLDTVQTDRLGATIRRLADEHGMAIVLVEHHVGLVLRTCDRIYALDFGRTIGHGTPSQIVANEAVVHAYLGTRHVAGV